MSVFDILAQLSLESGDETLKKKPDRQDHTKQSVIDELIATSDAASLWHTPEGEGWASVDGRNWPVCSSQFRNWLGAQTFRRCGIVPTEKVLLDATRHIAAQAIHNGGKHIVHLRVAARKNTIYLDLADAKRQAVRITDEGWKVIPPLAILVKFHRPWGIRPLPEPLPSDKRKTSAVGKLRTMANLKSEKEFRLLLTIITAALLPHGPYPVLVINGEQGSGKSVLARVIRLLVDPNAVPLSGPPKNEGDLVAKAKNNHVVSFDNVSTIRAGLADAICRLATGGGLGGRKLYTDADEAVFDAQRPIVLNGIPELAWRGDLADRAITLTLPSIDGRKRKPEEVLWDRFEAARLSILGWLLDAIVEGIKRRRDVQRRVRRGEVLLPRMADFAVWGIAVAPALGWSENDFLAAYEENRNAAQLFVLETDIVADAIVKLVDELGDWEATATNLLKKLNNRNPSVRNSRAWPRSPGALSARLDRLQSALAAAGINFERNRSSKERSIRLYREGQQEGV